MLFLTGEKGQGLVEYALILALIAMVVLVILTVFGDQVTLLWCQLTTDLGYVFTPGDPVTCLGTP